MSGIEARETVEAALRRELFGPLDGDPVRGQPLTINAGVVHFEKKEASRGQFHDADSGQEILTSGTPLKRYGVGVLFAGATVGGSPVESAVEEVSDALDGVTGIALSEDDLIGPPVEIQGHVRHDIADSDDFDLTDANTFKPSAMAVSFETRMADAGALTVEVVGARYEKLTVHIAGVARPVDWWVRRPFEAVGTISGRTVLRETNRLKVVDVMLLSGEGVVPLAVRVFSRPIPGADDPSLRIVTVAVVNDSPGSGPSAAVFQVGFKVSTVGDADIVPIRRLSCPIGTRRSDRLTSSTGTNAPMRSGMAVQPSGGQSTPMELCRSCRPRLCLHMRLSASHRTCTCLTTTGILPSMPMASGSRWLSVWLPWQVVARTAPTKWSLSSVSMRSGSIGGRPRSPSCFRAIRTPRVSTCVEHERR
jgi:hypothetical protein